MVQLKTKTRLMNTLPIIDLNYKISVKL